MAELKAGGLAILIKSYNPGNTGKSVTTEFIVQPMEYVDTPSGAVFTNHSGRLCWFITGDVSTELNGVVVKGCAFAHPEQLLPIDGEDFKHEGERKKELTI
ncbi:hypothetical protein IBT49_04615 [Erwinia sp. S63]|uniref:hypothetical protein n=1 Tax=Erwinia sp. S63 TaxID=2769341 RepID=UPI00190E5475|nr:hypothetical protein [Erwinia sp. S63]MBK0095247.1 hypothetical protein [Erwinia sp. S63]